MFKENNWTWLFFSWISCTTNFFLSLGKKERKKWEKILFLFFNVGKKKGRKTNHAGEAEKDLRFIDKLYIFIDKFIGIRENWLMASK